VDSVLLNTAGVLLCRFPFGLRTAPSDRVRAFRSGPTFRSGRTITVMSKTPKRFRDTQSFGKRQDFIAIAKLLAKVLDVYLTLVDDKQIDCVVRDDRGTTPRYCDIQIKARSRNAQEKSSATWPNVKLEEPRENFFFVFYSEPFDQYWVIPSQYVADNSSRTKSGRYEDHYTATLAQLQENGLPKYNPKFEEYRGAFHLLGASPADPGGAHG